MKKPIYTSLIIITFFTLFVSCKKEEHEHDHDKPTITLSSPSDNSIIKSGTAIVVKGVVNDATLHEIVVKLTNTTSGNVILNETPLVHDLTSYTIDYSYTTNVTVSSVYSLEIIVMDHSENTNTEKRTITVNP
jgi:hypothetical protein